MNKNQIKAELRRSACEDARPWIKMHDAAFAECEKYVGYSDFAWTDITSRIFILLVAEAL